MQAGPPQSSVQLPSAWHSDSGTPSSMNPCGHLNLARSPTRHTRPGSSSGAVRPGSRDQNLAAAAATSWAESAEPGESGPGLASLYTRKYY